MHSILQNPALSLQVQEITDGKLAVSGLHSFPTFPPPRLKCHDLTNINKVPMFRTQLNNRLKLRHTVPLTEFFSERGKELCRDIPQSHNYFKTGKNKVLWRKQQCFGCCFITGWSKEASLRWWHLSRDVNEVGEWATQILGGKEFQAPELSGEQQGGQCG